MGNEHTPGPWWFGVSGYDVSDPQGPVPYTYTGPGFYDNPAIYGANNEPIIECSEYDVFCDDLDGGKDERAANIALMIAAPETAAERDRLKEVNAELLVALDAAETMLRVMSETTTSASGTKPMMKTGEALGLVRSAIAKGERHD